ncbi:MAG: SRPBCC domain-containing protein [Ignavibacteria bacterium]|jgi:uncharacterized protein YndB with AHSA1/START domain
MPSKKYDWSQFTQRVAVAAPAEKVFRMWTDPKLMSKWLVSDAKMHLKKDGSYEWTWLGGYKDSGQILNIRKPTKLIFTFAGSICEVEIKKDKRGSLVNLRQYNIPITEEHKSATHLGCSNGWTFYLTNLKTFLEYGIDLRETDLKSIQEGTVLH